MTKFYNELEQSWRKLKQDCPEVAKAIEESDHTEKLSSYGVWRPYVNTGFLDDGIFRAPIPEPIKLDARRVAGWWCSTLGAEDGRLVYCVDLQNGAWLRMFGTSELKLNVLDSEYTFSQDPMKPLDQWQTLEQICGGEA